MVKVNPHYIALLADKIKTFDGTEQFNFYNIKDRTTGQEIKLAGTFYPEIDDARQERAIEFLMAVTLHQYGFWYETTGEYDKPMIAAIDGKLMKGSDFFQAASMRMAKQDPAFFSPSHQANLSRDEAMIWFSDDKGAVVVPAFNSHYSLALLYGQYLVHAKISPKELVEDANASIAVLPAFMKSMKSIPGYAEDPLQKKISLLALELANRPEHFLKVQANEQWKPLVDYHAMRFALRTGIVEAPEVTKLLEKRAFISKKVEQQLRKATFSALEQLVHLCGKPFPVVDAFIWNSREYCPEMTIPDCDSGKCGINDVCARRKELFQPVYRTTFY